MTRFVEKGDDFFDQVYFWVRKIPKGKVAAYSQIAALASTPRAARVVGLALSKLPGGSKIPWHRVIDSKGMISIENLVIPKAEQARRLQQEGIKVKFRDGNYWVDLKKYLWRN